MVGTSLESFDFYVFAYFSAVFARRLFFTELEPGGAHCSPPSPWSRSPSSSGRSAPCIFGNLGDRIGRKRTLLITIALMGVSHRPDRGAARPSRRSGSRRPSLLVVLRILQGLSLGGEWGGAILIAIEHVEPRRRGFYAALPQLGSPIGTSLTAALLLVMSAILPDPRCWRGAGASRSWSRSRCSLSRSICAVDRRDARVPRTSWPRRSASAFRCSPRCRRHPVAIVIAIGAALLGIGSYSLMNTYTIGYGVSVLGFSTGICVGDPDRQPAAAGDDPAVRGARHAHRLGQDRRDRRRRHAPDRLPPLLRAPVRDLRRAGRLDDHRRDPSDHVLGGARRADGRPVRRRHPLQRDVDRLRRCRRRLGPGPASRRRVSRSRRTPRGGIRGSCSRSSPRSRSRRRGVAARRQPEPEFTPALAAA